MENNISVDEDELYKQALQEIESQEHSFTIHIAVPELSFESMLGGRKTIDTAPICDVHGGKGGVNAMTRAMGVIVLNETAKTLLEDKATDEAYRLLSFMTSQKSHIMWGKDKKDDTDDNSKG